MDAPENLLLLVRKPQERQDRDREQANNVLVV